jgi:tagaturonate reductase
MCALLKISTSNLTSSLTKSETACINTLPDKVLQFGTGVLLRGLPDYYIDKANRKGVFNGKVIAIKSTSKGDYTVFDKQNNLYTLAIRGKRNNEEVKENYICSSLSRVIDAAAQWQSVLEQASNPELQIIISNTTEAGIVLVEESIHQSPPASFPAKLTAFLYKRFQLTAGAKECGLIIIPTELIPGNGDLLSSFVFELAHINQLPFEFLEWLENHVVFCNSLVDRIVPGLPSASEKCAIESELGYKDDLMVMAEPYSLWAIEGDESVKKVLSFAECDSNVKIVPDISLYRELKLRLLNATHTLSCGYAVLSGIETVKDAMENNCMASFIENVMKDEVSKTIDKRVSNEEIASYINSVIDRFGNQYIEHKWISITMQYTTKMRMRCIPILLDYFKVFNEVPCLLAKGFAAYLLFMKSDKVENGEYYGTIGNKLYPIIDVEAVYFNAIWKQLTPEKMVAEVLSNTSLWGMDLTKLPGFGFSVQTFLLAFLNDKVTGDCISTY